jgi:hypothetical protein
MGPSWRPLRNRFAGATTWRYLPGASPSGVPTLGAPRPSLGNNSENASVWPFRRVSGGSACSFGTGRTPTGLRPLPGMRHEQSERPNPGKARGIHAPLLRRYRSLWSFCWRMVDRLKPGLLTLISRDGHGQSLGVPALAGGTSGFAIHGRVGIGRRRRFLRDNLIAGPLTRTRLEWDVGTP